MKNFYYLIFLVGIVISCNQKPRIINKKIEQLSKAADDDHSYSNLDEIYTTHLDLELEVNFENKTIYGVARHKMKNNGTDTAIFDTKGLMIQKVTLGTKNNEKETDFVIINITNNLLLKIFIKN